MSGGRLVVVARPWFADDLDRLLNLAETTTPGERRDLMAALRERVEPAEARRARLDELKRRVDAGRPSPGRRQSAPRSLAASGWAGPTSHDPCGTCFCNTQLTADGRPVQVPPHPWFGSRKSYDAWVRAGRPKRGR
jgi:hypothetical protein